MENVNRSLPYPKVWLGFSFSCGIRRHGISSLGWLGSSTALFTAGIGTLLFIW